MTVENPPHALFSTKTTSHQHRLFLDDIIHEGCAFHDILNTLHSAGEDDTLETRINSSGGYVRYGQQLINVMQDNFTGRSRTVLEAEANSMSALIFMAGDERVIYPHSILMVHDTSIYLAGKSSESIKQLEVYQPIAVQYFADIMGDTMTQEEVAQVYEGVDFWMDAKNMCERGMATKVMFKGSLVEPEDYLDHLDPARTETRERQQVDLEAFDLAIKLFKPKMKNLKKERNKIAKKLAKVLEDCDD